MSHKNENEVVLNKMVKYEEADDLSSSSWLRKESKQLITYFLIAFAALFIFGLLVNHFLL